VNTIVHAHKDMGVSMVRSWSELVLLSKRIEPSPVCCCPLVIRAARTTLAAPSHAMHHKRSPCRKLNRETGGAITISTQPKQIALFGLKSLMVIFPPVSLLIF
jgi:hypothetical protein